MANKSPNNKRGDKQVSVLEEQPEEERETGVKVFTRSKRRGTKVLRMSEAIVDWEVLLLLNDNRSFVRLLPSEQPPCSEIGFQRLTNPAAPKVIFRCGD